MSAGKWAMRNPAVKRIMQELREMEKEDSPDILAEAIEVRAFRGRGGRRRPLLLPV